MDNDNNNNLDDNLKKEYEDFLADSSENTSSDTSNDENITVDKPADSEIVETAVNTENTDNIVESSEVVVKETEKPSGERFKGAVSDDAPSTSKRKNRFKDAKPLNKKQKRNNIIYIVLLSICAIVFVFSAAQIVIEKYDEWKTAKVSEELKNPDDIPKKPGDVTGEEVSDGSTTDANEYMLLGDPVSLADLDLSKIGYLKASNLEALKEKNSELVAWLYVPGPSNVAGLPIDIAMVHRPGDTTNGYYLSHNFNGDYSENGWVFADWEADIPNLTNTYNTVIYGHARSKIMFWGLKDFNKNPTWYEDANNHFIRITTFSEETIWQIFSWYETTAEDPYIQVRFDSASEFIEFCNKAQNKKQLKDKSSGNSLLGQFEFNEESRIITLSTCKNYTRDGRVAVHAVLVKSRPRQIG